MQSMQIFPALLEWIFGKDTGYPVYVSTLRQLGIILLPNNFINWNSSENLDFQILIPKLFEDKT